MTRATLPALIALFSATTATAGPAVYVEAPHDGDVVGSDVEVCVAVEELADPCLNSATGVRGDCAPPSTEPCSLDAAGKLHCAPDEDIPSTCTLSSSGDLSCYDPDHDVTCVDFTNSTVNAAGGLTSSVNCAGPDGDYTCTTDAAGFSTCRSPDDNTLCTYDPPLDDVLASSDGTIDAPDSLTCAPNGTFERVPPIVADPYCAVLVITHYDSGRVLLWESPMSAGETACEKRVAPTGSYAIDVTLKDASCTGATLDHDRIDFTVTDDASTNLWRGGSSVNGLHH